MNKRFCIAAPTLVGLLCACSSDVTRRLDGHVFDVPKAYNNADRDKPFFLPSLNPSDGFSFTLNPDAALPEQNTVGVASKRRVCARAAGTSAQINATIFAIAPLSWRGVPLRKVTDGVFWTYDLPATPENASSRPIANCFAMADRSGRGLCRASLPYGNLVLTIFLQDDQIDSLKAFYDQSVSLLERWKR